MNIAEKIKYQEWLESLKVGDKFVHRYGRFETMYDIHSVERLTATQIICANNTRFSRKNGRLIPSGSWHTILPITDEVLAKIHEQRLRKWFDTLRHNPRSIPLSVLDAMKTAYDDAMLKPESTK